MSEVVGANIIGESVCVKNILKSIRNYAKYPAPVLITGETGTGKELVARGLHYSGAAAGKPFIAINCSTFSDELFISELFGHKKGAFTDAKSDHKGLLSAANGGTIFLDEIDSLSLKSQAALLRLLQENEYRPIGSSTNLKANVRFVAAANTLLPSLISKGQFREDLYYRLYILTVHMPPLRDRKEDIELLVNFFLQKLNQQYGLERTNIDELVLSRLKQHDWPGNVRELENTVHRLYLTANGTTIRDIQSLSFIDTAHGNRQTAQQAFHNQLDNEELAKLSFNDAKRLAVENFECEYISKLMQSTEGNVTKAASLCGKERSAFGKLVKKYNINKRSHEAN